MTEENGQAVVTNEQQVLNERFEQLVMNDELITNLLVSRLQWMNSAIDPQRNVNKECGYPEPEQLSAGIYRNLYDRDAISARVVEVMPKESWQVTPSLYETEDAEDETEFETAWKELHNQLRGKSWYQDEEGSPVWSYLLRADILSGIGRYGCLLLGIDDGRELREPLAGFEDIDSQIFGRGTEGQYGANPFYPFTQGYDQFTTQLIEGKGPTKNSNPEGHNQYTQGTPKTLPDNGLKPTKKPKFDRGDQGDAVTAAIRMSAFHGVPMHMFASRSGIQLTHKHPKQAGLSVTTFVATHSGDSYTVHRTKTDHTGSVVSNAKKASLIYLKVFDEVLAQITMYERDPRNPRFGLPVMYLVTFNDPRFGGQSGIGLAVATQHVHWSRIIHVAEGLGSSDVFAYPRMQQPYNRIWDLCKVYASSGEGFWQQAFAILSMETNPQLGGDVKIDHRAIDQQMTNLRMRLKRHLVTAGMTTKTLAPAVSDPTAYKDAFIEAICIFLGCPVRVFKGSERGELASSQDDSSWNDRLRHRQNFYLTPRVIVPFIDRLIQIGVLPEPEGYSVVWPDLDSLTDKDKATISQTRTAAMQAYVGGNVEAVMDPMNFLTKIMGFDQEEANEIVEAQQQHIEEQQAEAQDFADQGLDADGMPVPEPDPQNPVSVKPGETLVHPQTGATVAKGAPVPAANADWSDDE